MAAPEPVPPGGILLIDWSCGFCQRTRAWIERHPGRDATAFRALDSEVGRAWLRVCGRDEEDRSTVVLVERQGAGVRCAGGSTAVLRTLRRMAWPYKVLYGGVVVPRPLRDAVYRWVSRNRHRWPFRG